MFVEGRLAVAPVHAGFTPATKESIVLASVGGVFDLYKLHD